MTTASAEATEKHHMTTDHVVLTHAPSEHAFVLKALSPVPKKWQVVEGVSRADGWPADVTHTVDPDYPHDMTLDDVFRSPAQVFLVSPALKDFLVARSIPSVEFLPVTLLNHKKKPAANYFILHPVDPVDCLDDAASGAQPDPMAPSQVYKIQRIEMKPAAVDPSLEMFRIDRLYQHIIVKSSLAHAIEAAGFTGVSWTELSDFHRP
jgi:hypothetical protein